jgi:chromosome partitioning protein
MVGLRRHRRERQQTPAASPPAPPPASPSSGPPSGSPAASPGASPSGAPAEGSSPPVSAPADSNGNRSPEHQFESEARRGPQPSSGQPTVLIADADAVGPDTPTEHIVAEDVPVSASAQDAEDDGIEDAEIVEEDEDGSVEDAAGAPVVNAEEAPTREDEEAPVAETRTAPPEDQPVTPAGPEPMRSAPPGPGLSEGPILDPETLPSSAAVDDVAPFDLPRVIAIANQKGGVGKTTTAVNLGAALAELDFRVLVVDLDPQGNATTGLGINPRDVEGSVYDVLLNDVVFEDIVEPTTLRNLFVAPATIDLAGAEIELVPAMSRELRLKRAIDQVREDYDLVLIDCPPSLGLLTVNGLAAADDVIVPIQCEYYALEGLGQLLRNVGLVQSNLNRDLEVRGIILTMYDARTKLADQVESEVRNYFGPKVYRTVVPRTVRLSEAPSFGQPIIVFDSTSRGASAYRELAKEVSRGATRRTR